MEPSTTRRAFMIHVGSAAALLGTGLPAAAQTPPPPVSGKEKLIVRSPRPINLETPLKDLGADITANELFFVRNNYDGPEIDPAQYVLKVDGEVDNPLTLSLADLRRTGPMVTETITWNAPGTGAASTIPRPRASSGRTARSGPRSGRESACPRCYAWPSRDLPPPCGPRWQRRPADAPGARLRPEPPALEGPRAQTVLALEMNGKPLPHLHGGPVRLIVPGWVGSASIKWLTRLTLASAEWNGPFMQRSYRSPRADDPAQTYSLQSLECKSLITAPLDGTQATAGPQTITGYAWAGEGVVTGVDVSTDGGRTWGPASLVGREARYAWRRWELTWTAASGSHTIMARASDSLGRVQPAMRARDPLGYRWNVIHAVRVSVA